MLEAVASRIGKLSEPTLILGILDEGLVGASSRARVRNRERLGELGLVAKLLNKVLGVGVECKRAP